MSFFTHNQAITNILIKVALVIYVLLLLQGCATKPENGQSVIGQLIVAEPLPIDFKSEVTLARLTEVIQRAELEDSQRAQLYYQRGIEYDRVGLKVLARHDFNQALSLQPDMVDAYNILGVIYTQFQEFDQAYDAFDSAIELAPDHEYAYMNRAIALYYGGRANLALDDIKIFRSYKEDDPYRILWQYIVAFDVDKEKAKQYLSNYQQLLNDNVWAKNIIALYNGDINQTDLVKSLTVNVRSNRELTERLCEAYFYLAKYNQMQGDQNSALNFYKLALSSNVYDFVEYRFARLEINLIRQAMN